VGERPNILNIVAWRNNRATFDSQQLATVTMNKNTSCPVGHQHAIQVISFKTNRCHCIVTMATLV